jgi:hypothetical protein
VFKAATTTFSGWVGNLAPSAGLQQHFHEGCSLHTVYGTLKPCVACWLSTTETVRTCACWLAGLLTDLWPLCNLLCTATCCRVSVEAFANISSAASGGVDLCTRSGVTGGALVDGFVPEGTPAPAGSCSAANADCGSPDLFCSMDAPVTQCTCTGGVDTCVSYGQCRMMPCASCNLCLNNIQPYLRQVDTLPALSDSAAASEVAMRFEKFCNDSSSDGSSAVCRKVSDYVKSAFRGYPGRRAGSICNMLWRCSPALTASCRLQPAGAAVNGSLDLCTFEGIAGGRQLADIMLNAGECSCIT